jgi:two-component system, chemotaxis family, protein-glutamate methylesterase/glutaminase
MASTDLDSAPRGVVAVGASAGGVEALTRFAAGLPPDLLYAIGSLMTVSEGNYRCRVGHAWTADALLDARDDEVDGALWVAWRSLQEKARLSRKLAENAGSGTLFKRYSQVADEAERALTILGKRLSIAGSVAGEHGGG